MRSSALHTLLAAVAAIAFSNGAALAQTMSPSEHAALFEENKATQGNRLDAIATWTFENTSPGRGEPAEAIAKVSVRVPDRDLSATWSLRRNTDKSLPASHIIEIMFTLPANYRDGEIQNVPGVLMKPSEKAKGTPLVGIAVKVTPSFFLVGLYDGAANVASNVKLLQAMDWIDIPFTYSNGHRAILAVEKGQSGGLAIDDAFAAWNDSTPAKASPQ
jgi:hypothetical protein